MVRLWLRALGVVAATFGSFGCSGQNVEGAWRGDFPLEQASDCQMRLLTTHDFTLACSGVEIVGGGRYRSGGGELTFEFAVLTYHGVRVHVPPPMRMQIAGHGNSMTVAYRRDTFDWKRVLR